MANRLLLLSFLWLSSLYAFADGDDGKYFLNKANNHYQAGRYDIAVGYYLKAAEFDEVEAMFDLGYALYHGEGIIQDYPSAVMWFKRAANLNYAKAEYNLAFCYMNGQGVPMNYDKALKLLISAANHGFDQAQITLAECYEHGVLVEQDLEESKRWKALAGQAAESLENNAGNAAEAQKTESKPADAQKTESKPADVQKTESKPADSQNAGQKAAEAEKTAALVESTTGKQQPDNTLASAQPLTEPAAKPESSPVPAKETKPATKPAQKKKAEPAIEYSTELPSFDIELEGELHEHQSGLAVAAPDRKTEQLKIEAPEESAEEEADRPPLIVYAPGMEQPKKLPVVKILYPRDQSFFHTDQLKIKYQLIADGLEDSTEVIAMVDAQKEDLGNRAVKQANTLEIDVPNRDCTVTLYARNKVGNSEPVSIRLIRENVAQGDLPRLFCVAIGVGEYNDPTLPPLKLSKKDASDFAEVIAKKKGLPFVDVQVKLLTDKEATRADIFEAMEWLQQEATPNDICIFYYAGHGYRDEKDRFYFMPYGATTDKLYNCFSAVDFKNMADDINCKFVVFADACYSASLMEGTRSAATTHFIEQLRRTKNGTMLYASSASDTKSKESPEWGNGAFTKSLIAAYNGGARQQFDEGLSTQALEMYLYKEVRRITNFKQTPIFINSSGMEHFNLFTYGE